MFFYSVLFAVLYRTYVNHTSIVGLVNTSTIIDNEEWILHNGNVTDNDFGLSQLKRTVLSPTSRCSVYKVKAFHFYSLITLILSGDVNVNPGPIPVCVACDKGVRKNSKAIECDLCAGWTHLKCTNEITTENYENNAAIPFICNSCSTKLLPGYFDDDPVDEGVNDQSLKDKEDVNVLDFSCFKGKGLTFIHLNVRSLVPKLDQIKNFANSANAAVLSLSETWLDESVHDNEVRIDGYVIERRDRNREGGGVCIYIRENLAFTRRPDVESDDLEFLAVDLLLPKTKPILIGTCYRPPKDKDYFSKLEKNILNSPTYMQQESYILGDFNTNVEGKYSSLNKALNGFMNLFNFKQLINEPTRVTVTSSSTIDLILSSDPDRVTQSGVVNIGMSDHNAIFCSRKINKGFKLNKHNTCKIRSMKDFDQDVFVDKLRNVNWFDVLNCENVDMAWSKFKKLFIDVIDTVAPVKEVRLKYKSEDWFTGELVELIHERDKALMKFRKCKDNEMYNIYKNLRNKVQYEIRKAKKNYVKNVVKENQSCAKKLWKTIKNLGVPSKTKSACNIGLKDEISGEIVFDNEVVASKFNMFFSNIASKLVSKLPEREFDDESLSRFYLQKGVTRNSFSFTIVSEEEVSKLLSSLNVAKSTGCDNISAQFVKYGAAVISTPVTYIINLSLTQSMVPSDFKLARVIPLYKKGSRSCEGNYRPVSILPVLSKVFERIVYNQFHQYLCDNNILYRFQSGFRPSFSTETALTFLCDKIKLKMDNGMYTGLVLLDLQKAFDTVNHQILIKKLEAVGANRVVTNWFLSYVSDRKQIVQIKDSVSDTCNMNCGVPQGSILGPLLFSIYINDMERATNCDLCLYADDSALIVSGKNVSEIEEDLSRNLSSLKDWLEESKLSLHVGKTESIIFGSKRRLRKVSSFNVKCGEVTLRSKTEVKYLGATLDQCLSGNTMCTNVIRKVNSGLKFLYRKACFLETKERKMICTAFLQSKFDYGCNIWYRSVTKAMKHKLQSAQNKIVRFILKYEPRTHLMFSDFTNVGFLNVQSRVDYLSLNMMYNIFNDTAPAYMSDYLPRFNQNYNTRRSENSFVVSHVNSYGSTTFKWNGVKLWNNLPNSIKCIESKSNFKRKSKKLLFEKMHAVEISEFSW